MPVMSLRRGIPGQLPDPNRGIFCRFRINSTWYKAGGSAVSPTPGCGGQLRANQRFDLTQDGWITLNFDVRFLE
jgi:hypothetical protein